MIIKPSPFLPIYLLLGNKFCAIKKCACKIIDNSNFNQLYNICDSQCYKIINCNKPYVTHQTAIYGEKLITFYRIKVFTIENNHKYIADSMQKEISKEIFLALTRTKQC